jgi:hypothetical protein
MKRFALAILVVMVAATSVLLALNWPRAEASPDVTITVNGTDDTVGPNSKLTLREAMKLATGELLLGELSPSECGQVSGAAWDLSLGRCGSSFPVASSSHTIVFDPGVFPLGNPTTIHLSNSLPVLDTGDDTLDGSGAGVIVEGGTYNCFKITSNNNTIKGLEINGCWAGVYVHDGAQDNTVGGSDPGEGNVLSGSSYCEVLISGSGTNGNVVKGNYIGTDASGTATVPNDWGGVCINSGAQNNTVGGSNPGEGNVISGGNYSGVRIEHAGTNGNVVKGNYIGTDASGTVAVPNGSQGVLIRAGPQNNTIGGTAVGEGNVIAFNDGDGVWVDGTVAAPTGNTIRGNSIHSNGGKGIENYLGGNEELPPPIITGVASVTGTACPNCLIDIYSDDEGEGRVYEGSTTADGVGHWSFSGTPGGPNITATATDSGGNTSEFSAPVAVPEPTPTPTPTPSPTPTVGPTRSLFWGPGWHNVTWSGASTPEEAFACTAGNYAAAYRLVGGGWERYFPNRPDLSNMTDLGQYDAFLILVTADVTCQMAVADPPGTERTLDWSVGWQNEAWTGADSMPAEDVFDCADGSYAAAYRLVGGGWERYFPDRPEISNMGPLDEYDAFLILVTAPVSCGMPIAP